MEQTFFPVYLLQPPEVPFNLHGVFILGGERIVFEEVAAYKLCIKIYEYGGQWYESVWLGVGTSGFGTPASLTTPSPTRRAAIERAFELVEQHYDKNMGDKSVRFAKFVAKEKERLL